LQALLAFFVVRQAVNLAALKRELLVAGSRTPGEGQLAPHG
jgi:hypothetical protein